MYICVSLFSLSRHPSANDSSRNHTQNPFGFPTTSITSTHNCQHISQTPHHTFGRNANHQQTEDKRIHRYALAAFLTAMGIAGPLGLKAIATIAGKALVISKVALTIAGIIALKKIFSKDHHGEKSFHVEADTAGDVSGAIGGVGGANRRNMYILRPVKPMMSMSGHAGGASGFAPMSVNDPYGYYNHYDRQ